MTTATFSASTRFDHATNRVQWKSRFASLPHSLLTHETFQELAGGSAKLLLAMLSNYSGSNNGHLTATFSRMATYGFKSKDSIARGLCELLKCGYIVRTRTQFHRKPALYAVTWLPINAAPDRQPYDAGFSAGDESSDTWRMSRHRVLEGAA